jgi:hypothetical protein
MIDYPYPRDDQLVLVCSHCLKASCWQGIFYCEQYKSAGIVYKTRTELIALNREDPSYWEKPSG